MPILVNLERIPEEAIDQEAGRLALLPGLRAIADEAERKARARCLAEEALIDRVLLRQERVFPPFQFKPTCEAAET